MTRRTTRPWALSAVPVEGLKPKAEWPSEWESAALALWNMYASYRTQMHVGLGPDRFVVPNLGKLEVMFALKLWCATMQIDPALWIYSTFAALQWRSPSVGHLFSKKMIQHFRTWEGENRNVHHGAQLQAKLEKPDAPVTEAGERVKQGFSLRGRASLCMASPELSGGYSSASLFCRGCSLAQQCHQQ